jgi:hypothetical protein
MNQAALVVVCAILLCSAWRPACAAIYKIAISPPAIGALNLGTATWQGDHGIGLSPKNESNQPSSTASGNVLNGITYDDAINLLTFDFGYGSAFGFNDLVFNFNGGVHIHGNGSVTARFPNLNTNGGNPIYDFAEFHTAAGPRSGRVTGSVTLSDTHEIWLLDHKLYFNIHTSSPTTNTGEIRGQLVPVSGDFNGDGNVDAADYVAWRHKLAQGTYTDDDYAIWQFNFGQTVEGSTLGSSQAATPVPETCSVAFLTLLATMFAGRMHRPEPVAPPGV